MGIFGHFKEQEQRLDALEDHVRFLTEVVQQNEIDLATGLIALLALQAQIDEKVSAADVDPMMKELNEQLGVAREQYKRASAAAAESWSTMQTGVRASLAQLRDSAARARDQLTQD